MRVAYCPVKPQGVVSGSQPHISTIPQFSEMSLIRLAAGDIMPWNPCPQTCLEPQYQPSQLSGFLTCWVKPPIISRSLPWWPCGVWMVLHSPCPSPCTRMESGPYFLCCRFTSLATIVVASSQEILLYLLLPRFWGFFSPLGSQSTLCRGYLIRLGEKVLFLYASEKVPGSAFIRGSSVLPFLVIFQGFNFFLSYFQS